MSPSALLALYALCWKAARPILRRNRRLRDGWEQRLVPDGWADPCDLWIQAASGGECALTRELTHELTKDGTPLRLLLTTWTRQGMDILDMVGSDLEVHAPSCTVTTRFLPLDDPDLTGRAMAQARPRLLVVLETELWPGLLTAAREASVPVIVINGRMTAGSLTGYIRASRLAPALRRALAPSRIAAISQTDLSRFASLFPDVPAEVVPNIKFDRATAAAVADTAEAEAVLGRRSGIRLLASTRREEEAVLLDVVGRLAARGDGVTVVAPRHPHRFDAWERGLRSRGIDYGKRSLGRTDAGVVLWDRFGELGRLYALADTVFVGGSMADLGGQNMLEPLAHGRIPCTGPFTGNFSWATDGPSGLKAARLLTTCADADALVAALSAPPARSRAEVREAFARWLTPHRGGTRRSADIIRDALSQARP